MKRTLNQILCGAALISTLCSCNEKEIISTGESGYIRTVVSVIGDISTKATGVTAAEEENINNLQLFVFDEKGVKEYYVDAGGSSSSEIVSKDGKKSIVAIVNAPSLKDIGTKTELMAHSSYLSDNSLGSLVMTGEVEAVIQHDGKITIPVTRIISKITIKKITSAFTSAFSSKELKIKSIYLINVAGDNSFSASSSPTMWYNKLYDGRNDSGCKSFPLLSDPVNSTVAPKSSYTKDHSFFCYPNMVQDESFDSTWSPRHTMLVVDALLGGEQTYYPIELPVIGRNKCIIIDELILTRKGSDYPYIPVSDEDCTATVTVVPWDVIFEHTETI